MSRFLQKLTRPHIITLDRQNISASGNWWPFFNTFPRHWEPCQGGGKLQLTPRCTTIYLAPKQPLFLIVTPPKQGRPFSSKTKGPNLGSRYIYIYLSDLLAGCDECQDVASYVASRHCHREWYAFSEVERLGFAAKWLGAPIQRPKSFVLQSATLSGQKKKQHCYNTNNSQ